MKISEFCLLNGTSLKKNEGEGGYLYLDTANITNGVVDSFQKYSSYADLPSRARRKVANNSIVYSTVRPNQQHFGIITNPPDNLIVSTGFCVIDVDEKIANPRYVYYYLSQDSITKKLHAIAEQATTAYPSIKAKDLGDLEIELPDLDRQNEVAKILSSLDEKIVLNSAINDNLSAVAKQLTRRFFLETLESPKKLVSLNEIATFENGYSYKSPELQESSTAMATIGNFTRSGEFKSDGFKEIVIGKKIRSSQFLDEGDVVVAHTDVTQAADIIGRAVQILDLNGYNQAIFSCDLVKVIPKEGYSRSFIAALLSSREFHAHCKGYTNGTTVLHLRKTALPEYVLTLPEDGVKVEELSRALERITRLRSVLIKENRMLGFARDTLLRKLMRG